MTTPHLIFLILYCIACAAGFVVWCACAVASWSDDELGYSQGDASDSARRQ